jgi:hypothetical protein
MISVVGLYGRKVCREGKCSAMSQFNGRPNRISAFRRSLILLMIRLTLRGGAPIIPQLTRGGAVR